MQKIERLVAITLLLQARGKMTAKRLAAIMGTSTRTIYRDINALSLAHVPVTMDYGPGGGYYLPEDYSLESAIFTREEAVSLVLSADISENSSLFAGDEGLHRALIKLEAALPQEYRAGVHAARSHILLDTAAWYRQPRGQQPAGSSNKVASANSTYLEVIRSAVLDAHQLDILYPCIACENAPGIRWRRVEPYGLVFRGLSRRHLRTGVWYMVAFCHTCQAYQTFRLSYIEDLRIREEPIDEYRSFDLHSYWQKARALLDGPEQAIPLILRVSSSALSLVTGDYVVLSADKDGNAVIQANLASEEAAVSYVLSLGAGAIVMSPPQVRSAVLAAAQAITEIYEHS
jgi:predicted DNA-binding transcriptional regulator YafY